MNLERFGFTPTESKAYHSLLKLGSSTGYAIARDVGIARANAYQALDGLVRHGAARRAGSIPVQYSAIPPSVLVADLGRSIRHDLQALEDALRSVAPPPHPSEPALVAVSDAEVLLDHAAELCRTAHAELYVVMGPWASSLISPIVIARARGVTVRVMALGEPAPDGATIRTAPAGDVRSYWGGLPVLVLADRVHTACGVLGDAGASAGIVTSSPGLAPFLRHLVRRELAGAPP